MRPGNTHGSVRRGDRGYTPAEQERWERVRLQAAEWFEAGESTKTVAARLRVHERSVTRWRKAWREGGGTAGEGAHSPSRAYDPEDDRMPAIA
ncbi:helix-turn-helix domain-containing protein [Nonomuraea sp. M3C6]|uniref:Helix-turn-helix domain-containing protein n=1 Tax=Nonomuraea marmarensis TaxID=3351344 RepID=A0ABW7APW2_9ACTN